MADSNEQKGSRVQGVKGMEGERLEVGGERQLIADS